MRTTIRPTLAAGALAAAGLLAMGSAVAAANASPADLPPEMAQGNVKYMSGGIGIDEAEAMRAEAARYPLTLEFAERASPKDVYLAAVDVHIVDQSGRTTLDAVSEGPLMLLRLPAGTYRVTAEHDGKSETRDVTVTPGKPGRLFFEWS
jgi:hypothetical protein